MFWLKRYSVAILSRNAKALLELVRSRDASA